MLKQELVKKLEKSGADYAFVIKDLSTEKTWKHRENEVIKSASLIKVFIMAEVLRRVRIGALDAEEGIPVHKKDIVPFSVLEFLNAREYKPEELLKLMIVYSDNTATNVLIDELGMENVNKLIRALGFDNSILQRKMMDFEAAEQGRENFTTPAEMADFLQRLYDGTLIDKEADEYMLGIMKGQADETMMRGYLPDEISIARKSGELDCLDHDIAIVFGEKTDYIYCFFIWNAESNNEARELLAQTSKIVYDFFEDK